MEKIVVVMESEYVTKTARPRGTSRCSHGLLTILVLTWLGPLANAQDISPNQSPHLRVVVAQTTSSSADVIAVPPEISWSTTMSLTRKEQSVILDSGNLNQWLSKESVLNGLASKDLSPWHLVIVYDQFDEEGDNVHSGVVDQLWAGPKKYRIGYKGDSLNQTDYATEQGLFRSGDQRWPTPTELQVLREIADPFYNAAMLQGFQPSSFQRTFGVHSLDCVLLERGPHAAGPGPVSIPEQYCFDAGGPALRYSRGSGWYQTTYNDLFAFQGRNMARSVEVTDGGKPYLRIHVNILEQLPNIDEKDFTPPADAVRLRDRRVTGVPAKPVGPILFPQWPSEMRSEHFEVTVDVVIGKNGHVLSAQAVDGPQKARRPAEEAVKKWIFQPFMVLGEPEEVESKVELRNN